MPPDARRSLEIEWQAYPFRGEERLWLAGDLKCCYRFPDQWVALERTDRSLIVLLAGGIRASIPVSVAEQLTIPFSRDAASTSSPGAPAPGY